MITLSSVTQLDLFHVPGSIPNHNPLFPLDLPRSGERRHSSLEYVRIRECKRDCLGSIAVTAASAWYYNCAPSIRNPEFARVRVTAHALAESLGFRAPSDADLQRAVAHPRKFWRQLPEPAKSLARDAFARLRPQAQHPRHCYGVDYTLVPVEGGELGLAERLVVPFLVVLDLYTRYVVAYMLLSRRPRAVDFAKILHALAAAHLLPLLLRSDNEGCFCAKVIYHLLRYLDVAHDRVPPGTPQHNGATESFIGHFKAGFLPQKGVSYQGAFLEIAGGVEKYLLTSRKNLGAAPADLAAGIFTAPLIVQPDE